MFKQQRTLFALGFFLTCPACQCEDPSLTETLARLAPIDDVVLPASYVGERKTVRQAVARSTGTRAASVESVIVEAIDDVVVVSFSDTVSVGEDLVVEISSDRGIPGDAAGTLVIASDAEGSPHRIPLSLTTMPVPECPLDTACQTWSFDHEDERCVASDVNGLCDDYNACTVDTVCVDGRCLGTAVECPTSTSFCGVAACDVEVGCVEYPNPHACPTANSCESASCSEDTGCAFAPVDDGTACGVATSCQLAFCSDGACIPFNADDGTPCAATLCGTGACANGLCVADIEPNGAPGVVAETWTFAARDGFAFLSDEHAVAVDNHRDPSFNQQITVVDPKTFAISWFELLPFGYPASSTVARVDDTRALVAGRYEATDGIHFQSVDVELGFVSPYEFYFNFTSIGLAADVEMKSLDDGRMLVCLDEGIVLFVETGQPFTVTRPMLELFGPARPCRDIAYDPVSKQAFVAHVEGVDRYNVADGEFEYIGTIGATTGGPPQFVEAHGGRMVVQTGSLVSVYHFGVGVFPLFEDVTGPLAARFSSSGRLYIHPKEGFGPPSHETVAIDLDAVESSGQILQWAAAYPFRCRGPFRDAFPADQLVGPGALPDEIVVEGGQVFGMAIALSTSSAFEIDVDDSLGHVPDLFTFAAATGNEDWLYNDVSASFAMTEWPGVQIGTCQTSTIAIADVGGTPKLSASFLDTVLDQVPLLVRTDKPPGGGVRWAISTQRSYFGNGPASFGGMNLTGPSSLSILLEAETGPSTWAHAVAPPKTLVGIRTASQLTHFVRVDLEEAFANGEATLHIASPPASLDIQAADTHVRASLDGTRFVTVTYPATAIERTSIALVDSTTLDVVASETYENENSIVDFLAHTSGAIAIVQNAPSPHLKRFDVVDGAFMPSEPAALYFRDMRLAALDDNVLVLAHAGGVAYLDVTVWPPVVTASVSTPIPIEKVVAIDDKLLALGTTAAFAIDPPCP